MSTVEFHPWNSRRADTEKPDEWRIDLDPMPRLRLRPGPSGGPRRRTRCWTNSARSVGRRPPAARACTSTSGSTPDARLRRRPPRRAGLRPRGRATRAGRRDDDLVAQGPRPDCGVRRLQPERPRPHDRRGLLGARRARRPRCRRRSRWDEIDDVEPGDFTIATMPGALRRARRPARRHRRRRVRTSISCWNGRSGTNAQAPRIPEAPKRPMADPTGRSERGDVGAAGPPRSTGTLRGGAQSVPRTPVADDNDRPGSDLRG